MMRSLSSAVGGLRAHQTKMDVIGNNIANVNTYGFKASRVTFSDVYYQTLSGGSAPSPTMGGTNPTQIGYGAAVATIDVLNTQSGMSSTDRALDVYINGDGMIATKDSSGTLRYSRLGVLGFDAEGNLVDSNGSFVQGFPMDDKGQPIVNPDGTVDVNKLSNIKIDPKMLDQMTGISIGTTGDIVGIMPGETELKLNSGLPAWVQNVVLPEKSDLAGDIKLNMATESRTNSPLPADWITGVEIMPDSGIKGSYDFKYDNVKNTITMMNTATGEKLTGAYVRGGKVEMKDATGKVMATVTTDNFKQAQAITGSPMNYTTQQVLTLNATDKGGAKITESVDYFGTNEVNFGSGTTQVTVMLSPSDVKTNTEANITFDYAAVNASNLKWIQGAQIKTTSGVPVGDISIQAGVDYKATTTVGSASSAYNFLDKSALEQLIHKYSTDNGKSGDVTIDLKEDTVTGDWDLTIKMGTDTIGTVAGITPNAASTSIIIDGIELFKSGATFDPEADVTGDPIGSSAEVNVIRSLDNTGKVISEAIYKDTSSVTVGDITLSVDPTAMKTFFDTAKTLAPGAKLTTQKIGTVGNADVPDWKLGDKVATARVGEGEKVIIGNIAMAKVPNMAAMEQAGQSYFVTTPNSGEATFAKPGTSGTGTLKSGYLEMSNVDISKEFTDMITTQRGFQANTRIVTVSDEMLQELVNLKR